MFPYGLSEPLRQFVHTFDAGGMDAAQALLGHRDSRMTSRYLQHVQGEVPEILTKIHREVG